MILENYKGGVVIVYSMPRSGTTLFCKYLERKLKIPNAGEIFHQTNADAKAAADKILSHVNKNNHDFICKYFPGDDVFDPTVFGTRKKFYRVNLIRENIAHQLTSLYIATKTNTWQTRGFGEFKSDMTRKKIQIDLPLMKILLKNFLDSAIIKEKTDKKTVYDETLIYEEIIDYLNKHKQNDIVNIPSLKPTNYNFIYIEVVNMLKSYAKNNKNIPIALDKWYKKFQTNGFNS
jgi:hypothetical protein